VFFTTGADVSGAVTVGSGSATVSGDVAFSDGLSQTGGATTLADGASIQGDLALDGGTLTLGGDVALAGSYTQTGGSILASEISATGGSRQLDVVGDVTIADAVLSLTRTGAATTGVQTYTILTATNGIVGEFDDIQINGGGSGFFTLSAAYGPTVGPSTVDVTTGISYAAPARSGNQAAVGRALDTAIMGATSAAFQDYLDGLVALDTAGAIAALDALQPAVYDAHTSAAFATAGAFTDLLARRPIRCERFTSDDGRAAPSLSPCSREGWVGWATGFGAAAMRNGRPGYIDWTYGGGGLAVGADREINGDFFVSGLIGASRTALRFDGNGDGSMTTFDLGAAVAWRPGNTHVRGVLEYGHGWHDTRREVDYPGFSQLNVSNYDSDRITLLAEVGHVFRIWNIDLEPLASVEYTYLHEGSASETKNNVTALTIESRENVLIAGEAGFRIGTTLVKHGYFGNLLEWADGVWRPEFSAQWRQVVNDYDRSSSAHFRSAPAGTPRFRTASEDAQYGADLEGGVSFQPYGTRNTIHVGAGAFVGNRTLVTTATATLRIPF
jgi:uncharacterized protein with beta-barrel porin domain